MSEFCLFSNTTRFLKFRIQFPDEPNQWNRRVAQYSSPPGTRIKEILAIISCQGYHGSFSFTDIEIIPKPEDNLPSNLIGPCLEHIDTSLDTLDLKLKIEEVLVTPKSNLELKKHSITLVTHIFFDELSLLHWTLGTWKDPVSIVILVPVVQIGDKLENWQK